jgi:cytochrome c2
MKKTFMQIFLFLETMILMVSCTPETKNKEPAVVMTDRQRGDALVAECMLCHSNKEAQRGPILHGMETG